MRLARFGVFFLLAVAVNLSSRADEGQCLSSQETANQLFESVTSLEQVVSAIPVTKEKPVWKKIGKETWYQNPYGLLINSECFRDIGSLTADDMLQKFNEKFDVMIQGALRCKKRRHFTAIYELLMDTIEKRPRVTCKKDDCGGKTACAISSENRLNFTKPETGAMDRGVVWFHELLHLSQSENLTNEEHSNLSDANVGEDELYYWQTACFEPHNMVIMMKKNPKLCRNTMTTMRGKRFRYNKREVEHICSFFEKYINQIEKNYVEQLDRKLIPLVFDCKPHLDRDSCVDVAALNKKLSAAGLNKYQFPDLWPIHESLKKHVREKNFIKNQALLKTWLRLACSKASSDWNVGGSLSSCLNHIEKNLETILAQLDQDTATKFRQHLQFLKPKAKFVSEGPSNTYNIPWAGTDGRGKQILAQTIENCRSPELKSTSLCKAFETSFARPMARILKYWE